ncbi:unnamed protein product [Miscanthus lutarioriparius]|uniref:Reverse transcriptase domain-containing protein n=1 Tax=Miscanthus lutarioriparius TaxID=422564 RepID=A0A811N206_9POAL|nr:unnamed protein product [Miscanthus lutarioriparius]
MVNGCPGPWITCKRGLRQGDPLSPYLFLLVAETLQCMIKANTNSITHPICVGQPCAVLQYADDTLIVLKGDLQDIRTLKVLLDQFASMIGLHINYAKSTVVPIHMAEDTVQACELGCRREGFPQTYLGLPLSVNKLSTSAHTPYIQKADKYLASWQASLLNTMGRVVLVNSVLDSQLVYFTSSLPLPTSVIQQMDKRRRAFMWSGKTDGKASPSKCLVAWPNVCTTKDLGGQGIKDVGTQNICLLLKLVHRLHCSENSAWAQWVRQRACTATLKGDLQGGHWDVLRSILPLYQAITTVDLGDGKSTSFWFDVWYGDDALGDTYPALLSHCRQQDVSVQQVVEDGLQGTMVSRLSTMAAQQLQEMQNVIDAVNLTEDMDRRLSPFSCGEGKLDTGSIYKLLKARGQEADESVVFIWKTSAPPRVQLFMWLLSQKRIQCRVNLHRKHIVPNATCEVRGEADESPEHIINGCHVARQFWTKIRVNMTLGFDVSQLHKLDCPNSVPRQEFGTFIALSCWQLWKRRDAFVFRSEQPSVQHLLGTCRSEAEQWRVRLPRKKRPIVDTWCRLFHETMTQWHPEL